jgi:dephospho-CoA kinase
MVLAGRRAAINPVTLVVGITGGIGSGKSAATAHFETLGITVVDADLASRVIVEPGKPALQEIARHFGADILCPDGSLDRAALRSLVFADPAQRKWLEQLTHPLIAGEIQAQLQASTSEYTILSSPLLLETSQKNLCDVTVVVDVAEEVQLQRTMSRDANSEEQVRKIMAAQMSRQQRLALADEVLENNRSLEDLHRAVEELHMKFSARVAAHS